ncbi:MAG: SMI1/KNR4 family protein [wastewater metagenome]|nr:SMI1/KNR4 family protein [Candidatus Loosdrechtia aerotolerans]
MAPALALAEDAWYETLQEFSGEIKTSHPVSDEDIEKVERELGLTFPTPYRNFIKKAGILQADYLGIYGIFPDDPETFSVSDLTAFLRLFDSDFPGSFLPFRELGEEKFACLDCSEDGSSHVILWDCNSKPGEKKKTLDEGFEEYLNRLIDNWRWWKRGLERLEQHINRIGFQYDHQEGGQLPRSHIWRPYRFCVQDIVLGITVIRHDKQYNRLVVDVFLTAEIPEYEADSGCRALVLILLSDAYKTGGSMEIRFTKNVEGGRVPRELCELAERLGVILAHVSEGGITPKESKDLYLALSEFRKELRDKIMVLDKAGSLSAVSAAYAVHRGVWTHQEFESLLLSSRFPESLQKGSFPPEIWHLFYYDLIHCRMATMGGYLDRQLTRRDHVLSEESQGAVLELEDDERNVEIEFDPAYCAKIYKFSDPDETVTVPWVFHEDAVRELSYGQTLKVLIRAHEFEDMEHYWQDDLNRANELKNRDNQNGLSSFVCVMYLSDFKRLEPDVISRISEEFKNTEIPIIICPDFAALLDQEIVRRLESVKVMRQ